MESTNQNNTTEPSLLQSRLLCEDSLRPWSEKVVKSLVKCPKCKNKSELKLVEVWTFSTIQWSVENGEFDRNDGILEPAGEPFKVEANCEKCKHNWRVRGAKSISDVYL